MRLRAKVLTIIGVVTLLTVSAVYITNYRLLLGYLGDIDEIHRLEKERLFRFFLEDRIRQMDDYVASVALSQLGAGVLPATPEGLSVYGATEDHTWRTLAGDVDAAKRLTTPAELQVDASRDQYRLEHGDLYLMRYYPPQNEGGGGLSEARVAIRLITPQEQLAVLGENAVIQSKTVVLGSGEGLSTGPLDDLVVRVRSEAEARRGAKHLTDFLLYMCLSVAVLIAVIAHIIITRLVLHRVELLRRQTEIISESGYIHSDLVADGNDEIAGLAREFNQMVGRIAMTQQLLLAATNRAEKASAAKSEFLATMSHEIRTPMTAILGYADLMLDPTLSGERKSTYLQTIRSSGEQLLHLINEILDVAKIEAGALQVHMDRCSLADSIRSVADLFRGPIESKGLAFTVNIDPGIGLILTDEMRLRQILVNLIGNALKFTTQGLIALNVSLLPDMPRRIGISICDSGIGIDPQHLPDLFEPFKQADMSTTRNYGGTGLGLAISSKLAQLLGGELVVHSTPGRGSCFTLYLPWMESSDVLTDDAPSLGDTPDGGWWHRVTPLEGRALLVEDNPVLVLLVRRLLERLGLVVETAGNGALACRALLDEKRAVDVVIMDMHMPEMDGITATRHLRAAGFDKPVLALTANTSPEDMERYMASGCNVVLAKPVNARALHEHLSRFLGCST